MRGEVRIGVLLATLLLAGCQSYALVPAARVPVQNALSVQPGVEWNRWTPQAGLGGDTPIEVWTVDGLQLHTLSFYVGVADGKPISNASGERLEKLELAPFRAGMTPSEIAELFEATWAKASGSMVFRIAGVQPAQVAGGEGFRFDFHYTSRDEVDRNGTAFGTVRGGKLYLIAYQGTRLYHYGRYLPEVERIAASATLSGT